MDSGREHAEADRRWRASETQWPSGPLTFSVRPSCQDHWRWSWISPASIAPPTPSSPGRRRACTRPCRPSTAATSSTSRTVTWTPTQTEVLAACAARSRGALDVAVGDGLAAMRVKGPAHPARLLLPGRLRPRGARHPGAHCSEPGPPFPRAPEPPAPPRRGLQGRGPRPPGPDHPAGRGRRRGGGVGRPCAIPDRRTLEMLVRAVRDGPDEDEEAWRELRTRLSAEERAVVDEALALTGKVLGSSASRAQRLEAWGQEYIGGHPVEAVTTTGRWGRSAIAPRTEALERREAQLEVETQCWAILRRVPESSVPEGVFDETASAEQVDAEVRRLFGDALELGRPLRPRRPVRQGERDLAVPRFRQLRPLLRGAARPLGAGGRAAHGAGAASLGVPDPPGGLRPPAAVLRAGPAALAPAGCRHPGLDPPGAGADLHPAPPRARRRRGRRSCVRRGGSWRGSRRAWR